MGYQLTNSVGDCRQWELISWWYLLNIAKRYGWQPARIEASDYFKSQGQMVSSADAAALASALEGFFNDVCRDEIAGEVAERMQDELDGKAVAPNVQRFDIFTEPIVSIRSMHPEDQKLAPWTFDEPGSALLLDFIAF
jgi:hypothetical protein